MVNLSDLNPEDISTAPPQATVPVADNSGGTPSNLNDVDPSQVQTQDEFNQSKYGGTGGQIAAGALGLGEGVIGPAAIAIARGLGASGEDIRGVKEANPWTHGIAQGVGLAGSALIPGLGEASLGAAAAGIGERAAALLPEGAGMLAKIAQTGVKTGAEMAALQGSDELSKMITGDPNQSLQSAAINIGLSGIMGGGGGAVIGSVSPLWNKAMNKLGVEKLASDYMGETKFLNKYPDLVGGAAQEINDRIASADQLIKGGLKGDLINKLTQSVTPEQVGAHVDEVLEMIENAPAALKKEPLFQDAISDWKKRIGFQEPQVSSEGFQPTVERQEIQEPLPNLRRPTLGRTETGQFKGIVTPPTIEGMGPEVTTVTGEQPSLFGADQLAPKNQYDPTNVFQATENLKRQFQEWGQYNKALVPLSERPFRNASQSVATGLKESLENPEIWGAAADAQKAYNKAVSPLFDIQKEFLGKFASKEGGERVADPTNINTYLNQADKSKAGLKTNYVRNYLDQTQKVADALNTHYLENDLVQPFEDKLNPTPILDHSMNTPASPGVSLARWAKNKGTGALGNALGEGAAGVVGGGLGSLVGHPLVGAWMGEKILSPVFSAFAKPFAESAINSEAAKSAVDYIGTVAKSQKTLNDATSRFFRQGTEVIGNDLKPDQESRDRLQKSLDHAQNGDNMMNVGGSLGHYMPDHATAAASTASIASNYFASIKPKQPAGAPFDSQIPVDRAAQATYNRQLDIAQQPLLALDHAKNGTLLPQDVTTIQTIFPSFRNQLASKMGEQMIQAKTDGVQIPYKSKVGLSQLLGYPMDSTCTPQAAQAILASAGGAQSQQAPQQPGKPEKKPTAAALGAIKKSNDLYATSLQTRAIDKRTT